jgi:Flp pilus assembly pilin Flp
MRATENEQQEGFKARLGTALCAFVSDCSGTTIVEYAVLLAGLCAAVLAGVAALGGGLETAFGQIAGLLG